SMTLTGAVAGSLLALVPAVLRVRLRVDDVVSSLLLNSIVYYIVLALIEGPWKDSFSGYPISPPIADSANFPILIEGTRLPLGVGPAAIFFAIVMTGAEAMSRATGVPVFLADVLQGLALLTMLVALLFTSYRLRRVETVP